MQPKQWYVFVIERKVSSNIFPVSIIRVLYKRVLY
jgi:hypothetical protein